MNERNEAFDALKGLLIVFVILGHVLLGSISGNLGREIIYFFHMPLFLAVTGYFVKDTLLKRPSLDILRQYTHRMLIPFIVAFIFYTTVTVSSYGSVTFEQAITKLIYPYYHLWYIPAVMIFIYYIKILESIPKIASMLVLAFFFIFGYIFCGPWSIYLRYHCI